MQMKNIDPMRAVGGNNDQPISAMGGTRLIGNDGIVIE